MSLLLVLALATFVLLIGFLLWNRASVRQHQKTGGHTTGIGGPNDPLSGVAEGMRHPDEMRADLDSASADVSPEHPGRVADMPRRPQE